MCSKCLPIDDFRWHNKQQGVRRNNCKNCDKVYQQRYYEKKRQKEEGAEQLVCSICKQSKGIDEFAWRNKAKRHRKNYCRDCNKQFQRTYYKGHKATHKVITLRAKRRRQRESWLNAKEYLLQHPCVDCGNTDIRVLHFDHVRGIKKQAVCWMILHGFRWAVVQEEIDKCEVRCANCHMLRHWPCRWEIEPPRVEAGKLTEILID